MPHSAIEEYFRDARHDAYNTVSYYHRREFIGLLYKVSFLSSIINRQNYLGHEPSAVSL